MKSYNFTMLFAGLVWLLALATSAPLWVTVATFVLFAVSVGNAWLRSAEDVDDEDSAPDDDDTTSTPSAPAESTEQVAKAKKTRNRTTTAPHKKHEKGAEAKILALYKKGKTAQQIATKLGYSNATRPYHVIAVARRAGQVS